MCTSSETGKMVLVFFPDQTGWPSHVTCGHHPASFSQCIAQTGLPGSNPGLLRAHNQQTGSISAIAFLQSTVTRLFFLVKGGRKTADTPPPLPLPSLPLPFLRCFGPFRRFAARRARFWGACGPWCPYFWGLLARAMTNKDCRNTVTRVSHC